MSCRRKPGVVVVDLINYVVRGLCECLIGIIGYQQRPEAAREPDVICGPVLFLQLSDIAIEHFAIRAGLCETIAIASCAPNRRRRKSAQPDRRMRFLNRFRGHLDILELEEFALEGDRLTAQKATNKIERFVGSRSSLLERKPKAFELFQL